MFEMFHSETSKNKTILERAWFGGKRESSFGKRGLSVSLIICVIRGLHGLVEGGNEEKFSGGVTFTPNFL